MRVDAYNKISQLYQVQQTEKITKVNKKSTGDKLEISQMGKDYHVAKSAVNNAPDIRYDKVNKIKEAMKTGTYNVDMSEVAEKLADHMFDSLI
ncbi:negative regulator of flagellin synthesis [Lachnospiraceae bacterium KM106-2]|nr:negative regulator of flagellin synthesis [Lachnospiraceae bacterium KM106-2]